MVDPKDQKIDSSILNLADALVSAFVNYGSLKETLFFNTNKNAENSKDEKPFLSRLKDNGLFSAVASLGLVYSWNFEEASSILSDFFDLKDGYIKGGACVALGLATSGVFEENEATKAMLLEAV